MKNVLILINTLLIAITMLLGTHLLIGFITLHWWGWMITTFIIMGACVAGCLWSIFIIKD